ncbi:MAG: ABC transporter permease [Spirochaetes bacterium]|nr:ABC transporter permease [Spirochaetota bacterium]MBU1079436.1 ABC transporter permease [Spirochaetota bacterium]
MNQVLSLIFAPEFGYSVLRVTTPILFATLGALIADKAGVTNIALEGIMLIAALSGVVFSAITGSAGVGLLAAVAAGGLVGLFLAYCALKLRTDIILSGIAINLMASGGTVFALFLIAGDKGISSSLASKVLPKLTIPGISSIPVLGTILSGHNVLTYLALAMVAVTFVFLYKTPIGLRIRAVGENPNAAASVGIGVTKIQYMALALSGMMAGLGGAYMSMGYVSWFSKNMTAGRGFIALAAEAMGGATPLGSLLTSLLFGFFDALSNTLQLMKIPSEFVNMLPYAATVVGLVVYTVQKTRRERVAREAAGPTGNAAASGNGATR